MGSNSDRGASRRSLRRPGAFAALLVALVAAACLLPGSAPAAEVRSLTGGFGPDGTSGTSFGFPAALAFDQSNKHLYALDLSGKIDGFDASTPGSHPPLGGSFPLAQSEVEALDDIAADSSTHNIFRARLAGGKLLGFNESGTELPGFPLTPGAACGVAVDTLGNVWVAMGYLDQVRRYSPTGALLTTVQVSGGPPCSLALDSQDNLYVGLAEGETKKYSSAGNYEAATSVDPEYTAGLAVDRSTDQLYVLHPFSVSVYDDTGNFLYEFGSGGEYYESGGIAIDEATEEVFLTDQSTLKVKVFGPPPPIPKVIAESADGITGTTATLHGTVNPKGQAVEDCHFEAVPNSQFLTSKFNNVTAAQKFPCVPAAGSIPVDSNPHPVTASATGLQPGTVYRFRLVAKNSFGEVVTPDRQFTSGLGAPLVEETSVEKVGTNDVTVSAAVNPRGGQTTYHVEYGTTNAYGQSSAESVPFGFPADNANHTLSVHIAGLQAGTAYHFRFVATNSAGSTQGADTTFATYPAANPTFAPCPNDRFRTGVGARLPDCRAYEQATPIDKHGANAQFSRGAVSTSGDRFTFFSNGGLPSSGGSSSLVPFLASRGPDGWSTDGFLPPTEPGEAATINGVDEDISTALLSSTGAANSQFFLRDSATAAFHTAFVSSAGVNGLNVQGFAADTSHLIFTAEGQLLPGVSAFATNLYDLDHGTLTLADRIPAGSATSCDDEAGPACVIPPGGSSGYQNHISRDGSRVVFMAKPAGGSFDQGRVYMREGGTKTTWISASQRTTPDPNGEKPAELAGVSADGSKVFFKSCEKLTDDSTAVSTAPDECSNSPGHNPVQGQDLYSYDVDTGELTDLTVDHNAGDPLGATVRQVLDMSSDGSYIYFIADGVLAPGASPNGSLYVYHDGTTTFVASVAAYEMTGVEGATRISDNGVLLFASRQSLTGYNNHTPVCSVAGCLEFFRYGAPEEKLTCVSCNPTGIAPTGETVSLYSTGLFIATPFTLAQGKSRNLSANGNRAFFESADPLVPNDTNGVGDVYEWEAKGEGSCESESQNGGCLYLISGGTSPIRSTFLGASKSGDHVFFFTEQQLVPTDEDRLIDVYDAGVGDGLAAQHLLSPPTCSSTACQANPPPPPDPSLASAAYSGAGNEHRPAKARKCPQGKRKVRSGGKTRCQQARKQHKRHDNRGGSK
jgi:hypothetical protein